MNPPQGRAKMVVDAGIELTLKVDGSFITLDPGGTTIRGPLAKVNAGGAPGKGLGIDIMSPLLPGIADSDRAGSLLEQAFVALFNPGRKRKEP